LAAGLRRTRRGSSQRSPDFIAGFKGGRRLRQRRDETGSEKGMEGGKEKDKRGKDHWGICSIDSRGIDAPDDSGATCFSHY